MKAIIDGDLVTGFALGDIGGAVDIPEALLGMQASDLRFLDGVLIDATVLSKFWIDAAGIKHVGPLSPDWQELVCKFGDALRHDGTQWLIVPKAEIRRSALHAYASQRRWRAEIAGVTVDGLAVPTDERTQAVLTGAYARAKADPTYVIARWKIGPGQYLGLSNEQIVAIGERVAGHIQSCFDLNATIDEQIEAGEITVEAQIDGAFAAAG